MPVAPSLGVTKPSVVRNHLLSSLTWGQELGGEMGLDVDTEESPECMMGAPPKEVD